MVVVYSKDGQLANRLWQAAHFVANSIEHHYKLLHLGFADYSEHYSESFNQKNSLVNYRIVDRNKLAFTEKLLLKYINFSKKTEQRLKQSLPFIQQLYFLDYTANRYHLNDPAFVEAATHKILLVDGWFYEDKTSLQKHAAEVKKLFTPNRAYLQQVEQLKTGQFAQYDAVVGVHIRRGDYKTYNNGQWYYSNETYIGFMDQVLQTTTFSNKRTAFFICSNEALNYDEFSRFNLIKPTGHLIEDLYALAACTAIIGPPSTFSGWASFYGDVPLFHAFQQTDRITDASFKVIDYGY